MTRQRRRTGPKQHKFRNRLVLNQWMISQFGIDPLKEYEVGGRKVRAFHKLTQHLRDTGLEGLDDPANLHKFYYSVNNQVLGLFPDAPLTKEQLLAYEENIVSHTEQINEKRHRPIKWKYFQWLTLLFAEIYLDKYFSDREGLLNSLNEFVDRFNRHWSEYADVPKYELDDLNKLCLQNATGSGKTLLMHVNLLQFRHYAKRAGLEKDIARIILLTPNERLSVQHCTELEENDLTARHVRNPAEAAQTSLNQVDVFEITKLADKDGPQQIATRNLGDQNLLLVDEGHRGMSSTEEGAWFSRRNSLCEKGFTFEYSATFEQAVSAAKDERFTNSYSKSVFFDYSYRYFYEDGFGKDYQILNLPKSYEDTEKQYFTACLLKFYQQLRIYADKQRDFIPFNLEKPLWVFVGASVTGGSWKKDEAAVASDVAKILQFVAGFLSDPKDAQRRMNEIITGTGEDTGLLDKDGNDIFAGSFAYLAREMNAGETAEQMYHDILETLFNNQAGGTLVLSRLKGESGEVLLKCGTAEEPFGLINVGNAKELCDHVERIAEQEDTALQVTEDDFSEPIFATVTSSSSPVNLLIGAKRFIEGWDCWRVSTMGLMHVGKKEGSQIIQLFGRGVRLKGWQWSLKRSGHTNAQPRPNFIEEIETLNVFGIEADFMERFREFLKEEGLPGNERKKIFNVPLTVTYDFGKKLKVVRPKRKSSDGLEYDFKRDAPVPQVGDVPDDLKKRPIESDWYPRIQAVKSRGAVEAGDKHKASLEDSHLAFLDFDKLYFELEKFKRERTWYNLNITKKGIRTVLDAKDWYELKIPASKMDGSAYSNVFLWQLVATELMKRYCDRLYNYRKSEFSEPRLEIRDLEKDDGNFPDEEQYQLIVDSSEEQVIQSIKQVMAELEANKEDLPHAGDLFAYRFDSHLYQPLFHVRKNGKIKIMPVALNESEYQFIEDLYNHCKANGDAIQEDGMEIFLLRNMSRGRGVGFFEASNFYPDFILWLLKDGKQYVTFIEPHGLVHEGPATDKMRFYLKIKEIEARLGDPEVILNSYILSWTKHAQLRWGPSREELEKQHVLFMTEDQTGYIKKLLEGIIANEISAATVK